MTERWRTARRRWRTWRAMPRDEQQVFSAAVVLLPVVNAALRVVSTQRLQRVLGRGVSPAAAASRPVSAERADSLAHAIGLAARHGVWTGTCLPRALVTWFLLRRRGLDAQMQIGASKDRGDLLAHAWVELQGRALDREDVRQYTIIPWASNGPRR